jgi:3-hydroxyisobutyrate dehydrogenase-like beta-hydroxyacid dehydrogenase
MVEGMLRRGETVVVWNRTAAKAHALEALGATVAADLGTAVVDADRVHIVLSDDAAVDEVLAAIVPRLRPETLVIDHTTTAPALTAARVTRLNAQGIRFLDAPVFMSPQSCRDATGVMLVAGPRDMFDRARPSLEAMTGEVWYVGERPDLAAAYKIFGNSLAFAITAGLTDVMVMAANLGVPPLDAAGLFTHFKPGNLIVARAEKMAKGDFVPTFELTMARKDMRLMQEAAGDLRMTVLPAIAQRADEAIAAGHGHDDLGVLAADALAAAVSASSRTGRY